MHQGGGGAKSAKPVRDVARGDGNGCVAYNVCEAIHGMALRGRGPSSGTHPDERKTAARGNGDATRMIELGAGTDALAEALGAAAGERGGRPGGEVDAADAVVDSVLRSVTGAHADARNQSVAWREPS